MMEKVEQLIRETTKKLKVGGNFHKLFCSLGEGELRSDMVADNCGEVLATVFFLVFLVFSLRPFLALVFSA